MDCTDTAEQLSLSHLPSSGSCPASQAPSSVYLLAAGPSHPTRLRHICGRVFTFSPLILLPAPMSHPFQVYGGPSVMMGRQLMRFCFFVFFLAHKIHRTKLCSVRMFLFACLFFR